jgi:metal-sulfur cluster biosynthetic enzyme
MEMTLATVAEVFEALVPVMDPEHPVSITDPRMGIVKEEFIDVQGEEISVQFKPTVPYCPMGGLIGILIRHKLEEVFPRSEVKVKVLPGTHQLEAQVNDMISDDEKYQNIIRQMQERNML